ncbi:MAG TPA: hypothetical protein DCD97_02540 [Firmicutes bacterium]|nr:hypothetical protein [Bacillota bacterium]HAA34170.1 hypothetical protein [Bacillota bacterium]
MYGKREKELFQELKNGVFVEEQLRTNADLVCLSAMMTSSMLLMKDIIAKIKEKNKDVMIMVGGAPLTPAIAEKFGADGFAENAVKAQKKAVELLSIFRNRF